MKPAPFRMQSRIWRVGMRTINALVDITNYVMLATGQPTHAFDSDNIAGHIIVRRQNGEKLELLNGKELALSADDLVIADEAGVVSLAGVMGGAKDSVLPTTNKVILEIANFQAAGVRRTACGTTTAPRHPPGMKRPSTRSAATRPCPWPCPCSGSCIPTCVSPASATSIPRSSNRRRSTCPCGGWTAAWAST